MALPANDAFTLAHDSLRRSRSLSNAPSTRSLFSSQSFSETKSTKSAVSRRSKTNMVADTNSRRHEMNGNGHATSVIKSPRSKSPSKPIDWEIPRKALHSSIGFFTIYLYMSDGSPRNVVIMLCTALAVIVPADILRLQYPGFEKFYERCLGFLMRESEKRTSNGVIWYLIGCSFALAAFPLDVATVSILILSWADTAASTFGRMFGSYTPPLPRHVPLLGLPFAPRKSLAGFIAASLTGAAIAVGFWSQLAPYRTAGLTWSWDAGAVPSVAAGHGVSQLGLGTVNTGGWTGLAVIGVIAGIVSGIAEALDLGTWDDNLTLPIISGGCLWALMKVLGLFAS